MLKHPDLTEKRIARAVVLIKDRIYSHYLPIAVEACAEPGEPSFPARIPESGFTPFKLGETWGPPWTTTWFRFSGTVPAEWAGRAVHALVRLGYKGGEGFTSEGLVWQEGQPTRAINVHRAEVPIAAPATGGEQFSFLVEAAANPQVRQWTPYRSSRKARRRGEYG
jgi:alpha-mannosidase